MLRLAGSTFGKAVIKERPEDFVVNEITKSGVVLESDAQLGCDALWNDDGMEKKFTVFVMQKRDWNTAQALRAIAKRLNRGIKSIGFAGTKDRKAITTQLCSIYGATPEQVRSVSIKDIKINGACASSKAVKLGELEGNKFMIRLSKLDGRGRDVLYNHELFPNYFGDQRFGIRKNNQDVGIMIMKGDMEGAAMAFLTDTQNELDKEAVMARERLKDERNFKAAMAYFPRHLKYEKAVIEYLSRYEGNYANALRKLPRQLLMMFVHSVEDNVFNKVVEHMVMEGRTRPAEGDLVCAADEYGFPDYSKINRYEHGKAFPVANLIGYDTKGISEYESEELERIGVTVEDFKVKGIPEINCKGSFRAAFAPYNDFLWDSEKQEVRFSLPAGSYATVFLNELFDIQEGLGGGD